MTPLGSEIWGFLIKAKTVLLFLIKWASETLVSRVGVKGEVLWIEWFVSTLKSCQVGVTNPVVLGPGPKVKVSQEGGGDVAIR